MKVNIRRKKTRKTGAKESFKCWNKSCLIHSKNVNTNTLNNAPNETRFNKTKGRVWNLIWWQGFWIHLTKFDAAIRKLNRQYDIQLAVAKTRFFPWYVATKCDTHDGNSIFGVHSASYPISLMLHGCITYDINMTLLWWMDVAKSRYQFISSS